MNARQGIVLIILLGFSRSAKGDAVEMTRFEREYPAAAKRLEERFVRIKGTCRLWEADAGKSKVSRVDKADFAIDHGHEKVNIQRDLPDGMGKVAHYETLYCIGEDTSFHLTRKPGAKAFDVEGIGSTPLDRAAYLTLFERFVKAHFCIGGRPMARVMENTGFRLTNAERVEKHGRSLVKVDYESGLSEPKDGGSIVFDPELDWVIRSMEERPGKFPMLRFTTEVDYEPKQSGIQLPRRVTIHDMSGRSAVCEFVDWAFEATPEAEFKMTFYRLPDLTAKANRWHSGMAYRLAGGALVALTAAMVFRRLGTCGTPLARS